MQQMDLMCVDRTSINWIVSVYYIAFGVSGLLLWQVPDKLGCRTTMKIFGSTHIICQWTMLVVPNYWVRLVAFAVMGASQLKNNVCYSWLFSMVHSSNKSAACSFLNAFDTSTILVTCVYFQFISREWFWLYLVMTVLASMSFLILMVFVPESPRWLLGQGREKEAIDVFNEIAKINFT